MPSLISRSTTAAPVTPISLRSFKSYTRLNNFIKCTPKETLVSAVAHKIRANKELLGVLPKEAPFEGLHERLSAFYQKTIDTEAKSADEIDYLKQTQEIFEMGYTHYFREKKNKTDEATSKGKNLKETKLEEDMEDLEAIISDFYSILRIAKFIKGEEVKDE